MPATTAEFTNGYALLIGVGNYPHTEPLPVTIDDATVLYKLLTDPERAGYPTTQVKLLVNGDASRQGIIDGLDWLIASTKNKPEATAIIYFSGHGGIKEDKYILVPFDFNLSNWRNLAISKEDFAEKINAIGTHKLMVFLDCCHAAGIITKQYQDKGFKSSNDALYRELQKGTGKVIIASCKAEQRSYIFPGDSYSAFTTALVEALDGGADNGEGYATVLRTLSLVSEKTIKVSDQCQTPVFNLEKVEDFAICRVNKLLSDSAPLIKKTAYAGEQDISAAYLDWVIESHKFLEIHGLNKYNRLKVPVEKVFVALKGDRTHPYERAQARMALEKNLQATIDAGEYTIEEIETARWYLVSGSAVMPTMDSPEEPSVHEDTGEKLFNLGEAYQQNSQLVILGDPGSGKTTLGRWLAYTMGMALRTGQSVAEVPLHHIDPDQAVSGEQFLLGKVKFPVLIRISEFAEDRRKSARSLQDFLGYHSWLNSFPVYNTQSIHTGIVDKQLLNQYIIRQLKAKNALIILDGLDEIPQSNERDEILEEVHTFIRNWISDTGSVSLSRQGDHIIGLINPKSQLLSQGNKLVVTSRIAGYHAAHLRMDIPHLTIEPMSDKAVDRFCDAWMQTVYEEEQPGSGQEARERLAAAEAESLKSVIHHVKRRKIRAMASNPLLCSILATVFHNGKGHLPEQRVMLYEIVVRDLIAISTRRMDKFSDRSMSEQDIFTVLEYIAEYIHQKKPTGLLPESDLSKLSTIQLALLKNEDVNKPSRETVASVKEFVRVLREDVGLMAARGQGVYGFLHLTFQEYLAARHLVNDIALAGIRIMDKIEDPRWQEPIRMALGYVSFQEPDAFISLLDGLLQQDGNLTDLLPRSALLIISALQEIQLLPDDVVETLMTHLLRAYANRAGLGRFAELRRIIEKGVEELHRAGYETKVEEVLLLALKPFPPGRSNLLPPGGGDLLPAAAQIIDHINLYTPVLVSALIKVLPRDSQEWSWPVAAALRKAVTPPDPAPPVFPEKPKQDLRLDFYLQQMTQTQNEEEKIGLEERIQKINKQHKEALDEYEIADEHYKKLHNQYIHEELPLRCQLPTIDLPFRRALENDPRLMPVLNRDPDWILLAIALYRGLRDYRTPAFMEEYYKMSSYLQLEDNERKQFEVFYGERWGQKDPIFDMAVYLDRYGPRIKALARKIPLFDPHNIFKDSSLTPVLLAALRNGQSPLMLIPTLQSLLRSDPDQDKRAEAFLALIVLGSPSEWPEEKKIIASDKHLLRSVQSKLAGLSAALQDPVAQSSRHVAEGLQKLAGQAESGHWKEIVAATLEVILRHRGELFNMMSLLPGCPPDQQPYVYAEHIVQYTLGFGDDAVYYAAEVADLFSDSKIIPQLLVEALMLCAETRSSQWPTFQFGWSLEKFPPYTFEPDDIPITVLNNLARIDANISFIRDSILRKLKPIVLRNPDLLPEIMLINQRGNRENADREYTNKLLSATNRETDPKPWNKVITQLSLSVKSHYHAARYLLRLAETRKTDAENLIGNADRLTAVIKDPHQKVQILEWMARIGSPEKRQVYIRRMLEEIPKIRDPRDQVMALARHIYLLPPEKGSALIPQLLNKIKSIQSEEQQAQLLKAVKPLLQTHPGSYPQTQAITKNMTKQWCRDTALQWHGSLLHDIRQQLFGLSATTGQIWAPVMVAARIRDAQQEIGEVQDTDNIWFSLHEDASQLPAVYRYCLQNRLRLKLIAAQALDKLLADSSTEELAASLLPLLEHADTEITPYAERWFRHSNPTVVRYAALLLAELQGLSVRTIPCILQLLHDETDLPRHRAARVLHHPVISPKSPTRLLSSFDNGVIALLIKEAQDRRYEDPQTTVSIRWLWHDLIYDDPDSINDWATQLHGNGPDAEIAEYALMEIEALTGPVWTAMLAALQSRHPRVQFAILISICRLLHKEKKQKEEIIYRLEESQWQQFIDLIPQMNVQGLNEFKVLNAGAMAYIALAREQLRDTSPDDWQQVQRLNNRLTTKFNLTFSDLLQQSPATIKATMKEIAVNDLYAISPFNNKEIRNAVTEIKADPALFLLLLRWLSLCLQESVREELLSDSRRYFLLILVSAAAESFPKTLSNNPEFQTLKPLLIDAGRFNNSYPGRAAAIHLLGYFRVVDPEIIRTLNLAMRDVTDVQQSAFETALRFRFIQPYLLADFTTGLYDKSAMVAYNTGRVLTMLGKSDKTEPELRRRILLALAEAIKDERSHRLIHFGYVDAVVPDMPRLDHAFYKMMMQVAGVTS